MENVNERIHLCRRAVLITFLRLFTFYNSKKTLLKGGSLGYSSFSARVTRGNLVNYYKVFSQDIYQFG